MDMAKILSGRSGMSITQVMVGMGLSSVAILAFTQMMEFSVKSNRGMQASAEFTSLSMTVGQLLSIKEVCQKALSGQSFDPALTGPQDVVLKKTDGSGQDLISPSTNPYAPALKVQKITLTKSSGASGAYFAQLDLRASKEGKIIGGKELSSTFLMNLAVDDATKKITGCSGSGDYVQRTGGVAKDLMIEGAPTDPKHAVNLEYLKNYVDAAGGGGGCFETSAPDCGSGYVTQVTQKRHTCYVTTAAGGITVAPDTLTPCLESSTMSTYWSYSSYSYVKLYNMIHNGAANQAMPSVTTRICCKAP